jgi:hypothetical protein
MDGSQLLIPAVLGAGAVATGLARRHQARRLATLLDARSTSVAELKDLQATVAEQMGAGSFRERVKLQGTIVCNEPLTAPWSGELCVAFTNTTTALMEVREERTSTDSAGNTTTEVSWERREETLQQLERRCRFELQQGGQGLPVDPEGAELELETAFNQLDPPTAANTGLYRQLGTRRVESLLRAGGTVLVVAECSDASGNLQLQAPEGSGLFVVRRGSEDDFSRSIRRWRRVWMASTWGLSVAAALSLLLALR